LGAGGMMGNLIKIEEANNTSFFGNSRDDDIPS
jgi:hypothetical protein